nr:neuroblastoma breakpoint family member 6 isoform X2 [Oryctolagus cuniculus]
MAGSHSPASDPMAELNDLECQQLRSQLAKSQQDCWELQEKFLIAEATNFALARELKKYNCEKFKNIIESILTKKLHLEKPLAEKPTVPELLRHCRGILEDQDQELSQLRPKVQRGRNLDHILQQYLKDVLTVHDPETCTGQGFRRLLTEAVRLSVSLEDLLGAENIEEEETPAQGPVADRELLEVDEMETPQNSQQETSITGAVDHLLSDSCLPEGTVQMSPDAEDTHSVLGVDGEHACSQKKEEPVTVLPENQYHEVEVQEQVVTYTSSRELPEEQEREDPEDSLDECYLTPSIFPVVSELDHSTWSSWCSLEQQDMLSAPDANEKEHDNDEMQEEAQALSHTREIPEIEDQDVSQDSHENQYHEVEVQEQVVTHTSRELPEEQEQEDPEDSLDECYLTPSISPVVSELDHSTWSSWCPLEQQDMLSAPDANEKEHDNDEVQEEAQALSHTSLIREIPEIEDQDVSQDSHENQYHAVEVQEQVVTCTSSLIREIPEIEDQDVSQDSHENQYHGVEVQEQVVTYTSSLIREIPEIEDQDVSQDSHENQYHAVEVQEQVVTYTSSLIREIPEIEDQDVSQDSHELSFVAAPERKTRSQLEGGPHEDPITSKCESHSISPSDVPSTPKENVIKGKWKPRKCELACRFPGLEMKGKPQPTERKIACRFPGQEMKGKPQPMECHLAWRFPDQETKGKPQTNMWALTFRFLGLHT